MRSIRLNVVELKCRGHRFAIVAGKSILRKFKTLNEAVAEFENNASFYQYWAGSASVSVENTAPVLIICR